MYAFVSLVAVSSHRSLKTIWPFWKRKPVQRFILLTDIKYLESGCEHAKKNWTVKTMCKRLNTQSHLGMFWYFTIQLSLKRQSFFSFFFLKSVSSIYCVFSRHFKQCFPSSLEWMQWEKQKKAERKIEKRRKEECCWLTVVQDLFPSSYTLKKIQGLGWVCDCLRAFRHCVS